MRYLGLPRVNNNIRLLTVYFCVSPIFLLQAMGHVTMSPGNHLINLPMRYLFEYSLIVGLASLKFDTYSTSVGK